MLSSTNDAKTINELRADFRRMPDAGRFIFGRVWDTSVMKLLDDREIGPTYATPEQWVDAAQSVVIPCVKCHGTGNYCWGNFDLNTKKTAYSGPCYQCYGRGTQNINDMFRDRSHTFHYINHAV